MATLTIYSDTTDGEISSASTTYSVARNGNGSTKSADTTGQSADVGQSLVTVTYTVYEAFFSFDTSSLGPLIKPGTSVGTATLELWGSKDNSSTDFTVNARAYDWGATLTTADYVAGTALSGYSLRATLATSGFATNAYNAFTSDASFAGAIGTATPVRLVLSSSRQESGSTPTGGENVGFQTANYTGTTRDPKLTLTYTARDYPTGWHLYVDDVDRIDAIGLGSIVIDSSGANATSRLTATYEGTDTTFDIPAAGFVELVDGDADEVVWSGRIASRGVAPGYAGGFRATIDAVDLSADLDRAYVVDYTSGTAGTSDKAIVQYLVTTFGTATAITAPDATVNVANASISELSFLNRSLRQAIEDVADVAATTGLDLGEYWVNIPDYLSNANGYYSGIAYGAGRFVATGYDSGSAAFYLHSTDGLAWSSAALAAGTGASKVAFGTGTFVIACENGDTFTSTSGTAWTKGTALSGTTLYNVEYAGTAFLAVGAAGAIRTSVDGTAWTTRTSGTSVSLYGAASDGTTYVVVGASGTILSSTDLATWTARASSTTKEFRSLAYGDGRFNAVGYVGITSTSTDGTAWTTTDASSPTYHTIEYGAGTWFRAAVGYIETSANGTAWTRYTGLNGGRSHIAAFTTDGSAVAVGTWTYSAFAYSYGAPESVSYYVDATGRLHYNPPESAAPYTISDTPDGTSSIAPVSVGAEFDESAIINRVYIQTAEADAIYGAWVEDTPSVALYGERQAIVINPNVVDAASAETFGNAYLTQRSSPAVRGSFTVVDVDGFTVGQTVTLDCPSLNLIGAYRITSVRTRFIAPDGRREYSVGFGALPRSLVRALAAGE